MSAKKPGSKKPAGKAVAAQKHNKKKSKGKGEMGEAPLIIKGGPQGGGTEDGGGYTWIQGTVLPLSYTFEPMQDLPNLYTLSAGGIAAGFEVLNAAGEIIFKFPNDVDEGDYQIVFLP